MLKKNREWWKREGKQASGKFSKKSVDRRDWEIGFCFVIDSSYWVFITRHSLQCPNACLGHFCFPPQTNLEGIRGPPNSSWRLEPWRSEDRSIAQNGQEVHARKPHATQVGPAFHRHSVASAMNQLGRPWTSRQKGESRSIVLLDSTSEINTVSYCLEYIIPIPIQSALTKQLWLS